MGRKGHDALRGSTQLLHFQHAADTSSYMPGKMPQATGNEVDTYTLLTLCRLSEGYPLLASLERFQPLALPLCKLQRKDLSRVFTIYRTCSIIP
jgi:hypothetical protein